MKMDVSIIGSGVVGCATGTGLKKIGHNVVFNDIDENKLRELRLNGHETEGNVADAVKATSVSIICVPTPTINGETSLSFVKKAVFSVAEALQRKKDYHVVTLRCTLLPSTTRKVLVPILGEICKNKTLEDYGVCYNPEFLRQACGLQDFLNPSRIVIGAVDKRSGDTLEKLYSPIHAPLIRTDLDTAEMIKHVSNAFLAMKISFFNEIYTVCKKLNIDDRVVSEGVSLDPRIGKYGVHGGQPFSGACLPKDVEAFQGFVKGLGVNPDILKVVLAINEDMAKRTEST